MSRLSKTFYQTGSNLGTSYKPDYVAEKLQDEEFPTFTTDNGGVEKLDVGSTSSNSSSGSTSSSSSTSSSTSTSSTSSTSTPDSSIAAEAAAAAASSWGTDALAKLAWEAVRSFYRIAGKREATNTEIEEFRRKNATGKEDYTKTAVVIIDMARSLGFQCVWKSQKL